MGQRRWCWATASRTFRLAVLLGGAASLLLMPLLLTTSQWRRACDGAVRRSDTDVPSALLWTMMRSGSRLTQKLLDAESCSFVTEEPLRSLLPEGLNASLSILQDLLSCRMVERPDLTSHFINGSHPVDHRVRTSCSDYPKLCWDGVLAEAVCRVSCFRLVRVVAQGLSVANVLLQDYGSNAHVVHLVRDPRAMFSSRQDLINSRYIMFAHGKKEEFMHAVDMRLPILCQRYRDDLVMATHLALNSPDRYTLLRYEDLVHRPHEEVRRLYAFLGLPYTARVDTIVGEHMLGVYSSESEEHPFSTKKKASGVVFAWRRRLPFSEVDRIQQECGDVLRAYGYRHFTRRQYEEGQDSPLLPLPPPWAASGHGHGGGDG